MFKFLAGMIVLAAAAAYFTKPDEKASEAELKSVLLTALAEQDFKGKNGGEAAALLACRVNPNACYDLVRSNMDVKYEDRILYAKLDLKGFDRTAACYGLYTRFVCPGGLKSD